MSCFSEISGISISIHSLRMEGDLFVDGTADFIRISIHSLRMEGDSDLPDDAAPLSIFQSTPSAWRETSCNPRYVAFQWSISIHSLRMEGDRLQMCNARLLKPISIHSLRMEGDLRCDDLVYGVLCISIHSLRMEGDEDTYQLDP